MAVDLNTAIAVGSFAMGVGSTLVTGYKYWKDNQRKSFAAEREFNHLKADATQLRACFVEMDQKIDDLTISVADMRGAITALLRQSSNGPQLPSTGGQS